MKLFWILLISGVLLGGISGGLLWYGKTNKAETVFEAQPEERPVEGESSPATAVETTQKTESVESDQEAVEAVKQEPVEAKEGAVEKEVVSKDEEPRDFSVKSALTSFGYESASGRKIDTVVLHSSYNPNGDPYSVSAVRGIWQSYGVAPHYMIARDGTVYQLVPDKNIAYHAGESTMKDGRKNVNDFSIGVEILNTKEDEYTKAQYQATKDLIAYLKGKYSIKYVVGHDDIAPGRKTDPWNFNWSKL
jgi:N-acetylmuramoyl-L-alanine amidase